MVRSNESETEVVLTGGAFAPFDAQHPPSLLAPLLRRARLVIIRHPPNLPPTLPSEAVCSDEVGVFSTGVALNVSHAVIRVIQSIREGCMRVFTKKCFSLDASVAPW
jgi:hypothetical protein